jgi:hypothetical protein
MAGPDDIAALLMTQAEYARHRGVSKRRSPSTSKRKRSRSNDDGLIDVVARIGRSASKERINEPRDGEKQAERRSSRGRGRYEAIYRARRRSSITKPRSATSCRPRKSPTPRPSAPRSRSARSERFRAAPTLRWLRRKDVFAMRTFLKGVERDVQTQIAAAFEKMASAAVAGRDIPEAADEPDDMRAETFDDAN